MRFMKFRMLRGVFREGDKAYRPGDVLETTSDLSTLKLANGRPQFERLPDPEQSAAAPATDSLDGMTVEELRQFAAESEVDLGKARTKDQILAVLRSA